jgi:hypothetical protein
MDPAVAHVLPDTDTTHAIVTKDHPLAGHPDEVFLDDQELTQVASTAALAPGTFYVDDGDHQLWLGDDPDNGDVEASTLSVALTIRGNGSTVQGIGFRRYATPISSNAAVRAWADDLTITNAVFQDNALSGLSLVGNGSTVRNSLFEGNGQLGLSADKSQDLTIENSRFSGNNREQFAVDQAAGGAKVTNTSQLRIVGNVLQSNVGNGLWLDESVCGAVVTGDRFSANTRNGLQVELSAATVVAGDVADDNGSYGIYVLDSNAIDVWNDVADGSKQALVVRDGSRSAAAARRAKPGDRRLGRTDFITWQASDISIGDVVMQPGPDSVVTSTVDLQVPGKAGRVTGKSDVYLPAPAGTTALRWLLDLDDRPRPRVLPTSLEQLVATKFDAGATTGIDAGPTATCGTIPGHICLLTTKVPDRVAAVLGRARGAQLPPGPPHALPH